MHEDITKKIIGAAFDVHNVLGKGLTERTYQQALVIRLRQLGLVVEEEMNVPIFFGNTVVGTQRIDLLVEQRVVVENKIIRRILRDHTNRLLTILRNTKYQLGLIINFGESVNVKRVINSTQNK